MVQDPETAEVGIMPRAAVDATEVDYVLPLEEIGPFLNKLTIVETNRKPRLSGDDC